MKSVVGPLVDGEEEVMSGDCSDDVGTALFDGLGGGGGGAVFEDDFEGGELAVEREEGG